MQAFLATVTSWKRPLGFVLSVAFGLASAALAQPGVFTTAEGQLGEMPGMDDQVLGTRFEPIQGASGDVLLGGIFVFGGAMPPPPGYSFLTDKIHGEGDPVPIDATASLFANVFKSPPASARSRNAADNGDFVAFSFAVDGSSAQTMSVRIATFDENGNEFVNVPVTELDTFPFPNPVYNDTGVAVDDQGRLTVVYTDFTTSSVKARRVDAVTGLPIGGEIPVTVSGRVHPDVALLDPAGNRLIVATTDFSTIRGHILDTSGAVPVVLPEFQVNTTGGFPNAEVAVAADPATGTSTIVWENFVDVTGDPVNVRGRRFDAMGNPLGGDFLVNSTTANAQGQPAMAYGPGSVSVAVWAGDGAGVEDLDVFGQAYDANGNPIGGEIRINTDTDQVQDRPSVRFLPEPDSMGQPQFVVAWRDVTDTFSNTPRGTGTSYKCFSIGEDPSSIFADGFESGDTSSW